MARNLVAEIEKQTADAKPVGRNLVAELGAQKKAEPQQEVQELSMIDRMDQAILSNPAGRVAAEAASAINRSIFGMIDFFGADNVNAALQLAGSDQRIPTVREKLGSEGGYMEPGLARDVVQASGEALPAAVTIGQGLRTAASKLPALAPGESAARGVVRQMGQSTAGQDAYYGALAGAGSAVGEGVGENIGGEVGGQVGSVVGGLSLPAIGAVISKTAHIPGALKRLIEPFTEEGKKRIAGQIIRDTSTKGLERTPSMLDRRTLGQETQDPGLLWAEKVKASQSPLFATQLDDNRALQNQAIREQLESLAPKANAEAVSNAVRGSVAAKREGVQRAIDSVPTPALADKAVVSQEAAGTLDDIFRAAKQHEATLWNATRENGGINLPIRALNARLNQYVQNTEVANRGDLPKEVIDAISTLAKPAAKGSTSFSYTGGTKVTQAPDAVPLAELQAARSKALDIARSARAAGENNRARMADDVARMIAQHLDNVKVADPALAAKYEAAKAFTRELHSTFDMSKPIANVLGKTAAGAPKLQESRLLESVVRTPEDVGAYLNAIKNDPRGVTALRDFIVSKAGQSPSWAKQSASIIDQVPGARKAIAGNEALKARLQDFITNKKMLEKTIKEGPEQYFLSGEPERAVSQLMSAKDWPTKLSRLQTIIKGNTDAEEGLQRLVLNDMFRRIQNEGLDQANQRLISPAKSASFIRENRKFLFTVFKEPWQRRILNEVPRAVRQMESIRAASPVGGSHTQPLQETAKKGDMVLNQMIGKLAPFLRVTGDFNPYKNSQEAINNLVMDGMLNPELGRALAMKATPKNVQRAMALLQQSKTGISVAPIAAGTATTANQD